MKLFFLIAVIVLVLFSTSCQLKKESSGSTTCNVDDDCISLSGCYAGCWNENDVPYNKSREGELCGQLGPAFCQCIENKCMGLTCTQCQYLDGLSSEQKQGCETYC